MKEKILNFGFPSKGRINLSLINALKSTQIKFKFLNDRSYCNKIMGYPNINIKFLSALDIAKSLLKGTIDFGITGLDLITEFSFNENFVNLYCKYNFGLANVIVAVPNLWIDVNYMIDFNKINIFNNKYIVIGTKYINLTKSFFNIKKISFFNIKNSTSAIEGLPINGEVDLIVDIISSGNTLKSNNLKIIKDGLILKSMACFFYNKNLILTNNIISFFKMFKTI